MEREDLFAYHATHEFTKKTIRSMLIAIAHGSRNPHWRNALERQFEQLQTQVGADNLQLAYMEFSPPTLMDVVEAAAQHGVERVRILPLFLTIEGHVTKDILPLIENVRGAYPSLEIEILPPLGQQPLFQEMLRTLTLDNVQ